MKFAKQLDQDLVPEWRVKYLNYKAGKKHIKAVSKAIYRAANTPQPLHRPVGDPASAVATLASGQGSEQPAASHRTPARPVALPIPAPTESDRLTGAGSANELHYGSFVLTPPALSTSAEEETNVFALPGPAINPNLAPPSTTRSNRKWGRQRTLTSGSWCASPARNNGHSPSGAATPSPHALQRLFSGSSIRGNKNRSHADISLQSLDVVRERQQEFFAFLDSELGKVEKFYRTKEDQAGERLAVLREQLHVMRNCRIQEMAEAKERAKHKSALSEDEGKMDTLLNGSRWIHPLKDKVFTPGPNSKAMQKMAMTPAMGEASASGDARRDYIRRAENTIPYRTAKRKLKLALQEFYRGLELLKSYALLNRTAFRKLNKKYDKAVRARPPYRYLNEKVNTAYFVTSDVLDGYIQTVEDLYARYFEKNNRKVAVGKLRSHAQRRGDNSASAFRNGVLIGTGLVFALQGLSFAVKILQGDEDEDEEVRARTGYLLQIYAGYFLMLYLFIMFCLDCRLWRRYKINYPFIFEFDPRHHLDWRELAEFPSFFMFVFGLFMWLNFSRYGSEDMYLWYPVVLVVVSVLVVLLPAPVLRSRSRNWFAYSHWRLLLAGFYPVEFRDFFLGDMYCSLTYATCNVELLFCLYARSWEDPSRCGSHSSRLLGFLSALPPIWRFLQCLRRYRDTRNVFPHLVNGGKYTMSIVAAMTLSLYRISPGKGTMGAFILFSAINAFYCSVWDLFMDFSLLQPRSPKRFLRPITAIKSHLAYYAIMTLDPILRFSWILLAVFTHKQHEAVISFAVALLEVSRRGMWALIRVENEHCANVGMYKASRDVPLPYVFEEEGSEAGTGFVGGGDEEGSGGGEVTGAQTGLSRILARAHTQDFEKRRRPEAGVEVGEEGIDQSEEEEEEEEGEGSGSISEDEGVKIP